MSVCTTILEQLGGNKFTVMTGAKFFIDLGDGVSMRIGSNSKKVTHVKIRLTEDDLYHIDFLRVTHFGMDIEYKGCVEGVNAVDLRRTFTRYTGLDTSL